MNTRLLLLGLIFFSFNLSVAQELPNVISPSPTAASLAMYADYPVSKYSGVPNINIPLTSINLGNYTLPISISYHSSGIKVGQEASWVGLGWALNAGGAITRQVRGKDDFTGWFSDPPLPDENDTQAIIDYFTYYTGSYNPPILDKDGESDIYYFNFAGFSGKFFMTKDKKAVVIDPKNEITIKNITDIEWEITDSNGVVYRFQDYENTKAFLSGGSVPDELTWPSEEQVPYVSSWFLSEIELPNKEKITFIYTDIGAATKSFINISNDKKDLVGYSVAGAQELVDWESSKLYGGAGDALCNFNYTKDVYNHSASIVTKELFLSSISWPSGSVVMETSDRNDLDHDQTKPKRLDRMVIKHVDEIKSYNFSYSYFNESYASDPNKHLYLRLKLDSITEYSNADNSGNFLPPYEFEYNTIALPEKTSTSTDYWGCYNGQSNKDFYGNKKYVPKYNVTENLDEFGWNENTYEAVMTFNGYSDLDQKLLPGANKESYPNFIQAAILKKIKYPTGGIVEFFYEPNSYYNLEEEYVQQIKEESVLACKGSSCNKYEFQNPPEIDIIEFYLSEETSVSFDFLSSNFLESCNNFAFPDGATFNEDTDFSYLDKIVEENGAFISRPMIFKYGDFSNVNNCSDLGYPNFSYNNYEVTLDAGWYRMTVTPYDNLDGEMTVTYSENTTQRVYNKMGGGLRVSKIKNEATERLFKYEKDVIIDNEPISVSSGRLLSKPNSVYLETRYGLCQSTATSFIGFALLCRSSESMFPLTGFKSGNSIGYDKVSEVVIGESGEKSILEQTFYNLEEIQTLPFFPNKPKLNNGLLKSEKYLADNIIVKEKEFFYQKDLTSSQSERGMKYVKETLGFYTVDSEWWYPYKIIEKNYDLTGQNPLVITTDFEYANSSHKLLTKSTQQVSNGNIISKSYVRPSDVGSGAPPEMYDKSNVNFKHMLSPVIEEKTLVNNIEISSAQSGYGYDSAKDMVLLDHVDVYPKGIESSTARIRVEYEYYDNGNVQEVYKEDGTHIVYIWGYEKKYPIAKIENATYTDIPSSVYNLILSKSDLDGSVPSVSNENILRTELNKLRSPTYSPNLSDAMVTTYTYDPLIGVTSVTDPKGYTVFYEYDDFNRLKYVRDKDSNILSKNEYNYKQ